MTPASDSVRVYLQEIGSTPLLTAEAEFEIATAYRLAADLKAQRQAEEARLQRQLTDAEAADHANMPLDAYTQAVGKHDWAKKRMIEANLRLVVSIAKKYQNRGVDFLDLIQEGSLGLVHGVEKFEPAKGYKFSTYGYWWVRQAVTRAVASTGRTIRLPVHIIEKLNEIKRAQRILSATGVSITTEAIVEQLNTASRYTWTLASFRQVLAMSVLPLSTNQLVGSEKETELGSLIPDDRFSPQDFMYGEEKCQKVEMLLSRLSDREQEVLRWRYGLTDGTAHTLDSIGLMLGLTRERIRQIQNRAINKLKNQRDKSSEVKQELQDLLSG